MLVEPARVRETVWEALGDLHAVRIPIIRVVQLDTPTQGALSGGERVPTVGDVAR